MITPSYSITATERVLPKLALDFTTASLDPRVTLTRALNTATAVNSSGTIAVVNANLPRFDYDPVTLACKGLLIEESRSNLSTSSGDLGNATYWIAQRATAVSASGTAPDGTNTATLATEDSTASNNHLFGRQNITASANAQISYSVYLKNNTRRYAILTLSGTATAEWVVAVFDLVGGSVTATSNGASGTYVASSIKAAGNSWYRCSLTGSVISANPQIKVQLSDTGTPASWGTYGSYAYNGNGTSSLYGWGAQTEVGAFPTSYIPTTTSVPVTRNADVATMTGTNFSSWYNATEGTFEIEQSYYSVASVGGLVVSDFNNNYIFIDTTSGGVLRDRISTNGVTQTALSAGTITNNVTFKNTHGYKSTGASCALNGAATVTSGAITLPSGINQLQFNTNSIQSIIYSGYIRKLNYWPQKLTNNEVQAFSK